MVRREWSKPQPCNSASVKKNVATRPDVKATKNAISTLEPVACLVPSFYSKTKWNKFKNNILRKCVRLSFFVKYLRRLATCAEFMRTFAEACVLPIFLYRSPLKLGALSMTTKRT